MRTRMVLQKRIGQSVSIQSPSFDWAPLVRNLGEDQGCETFVSRNQGTSADWAFSGADLGGFCL